MRLRWLSWTMNAVLVVVMLATGAHQHPGDSPAHPCVVCAVGHAPALPSAPVPAVRAPEPTCEIVLLPPAPAGASAEVRLPSTRGPPLV